MPPEREKLDERGETGSPTTLGVGRGPLTSHVSPLTSESPPRMKICFYAVGSEPHREPSDPRPSELKDQPATAPHVEIFGSDSKIFCLEHPAGVQEPH